MSQDLELVRRALAGEAEATEELAALASRLVHGLARKRLGLGRDVAEDLLQATLTRLWEHEGRVLRAWRGQGRLTTYLSVIVSNLWLKQRARLARQEAALRSMPLEEKAPPATPAERLASKERRGRIERILGKMRSRDRLLLSLRFVDEQSPKEIARMLGMQAGTARKALHDATRRLRQHLAEEAPDLIPKEDR